MPIRDLETWMWAEACEIVDQADRLRRQFFRPSVINVRQPTWEPPIDVYETRHEFKIMIALPGVAPEQLSVILEGNHLTVTGKRHLLVSSESHIRRLEIPYGRFERHIEIPAGHFEIGTREFVNGCLLISLRRI
jgi:HSP20 family molecular chaperone IbpA